MSNQYADLDRRVAALEAKARHNDRSEPADTAGRGGVDQVVSAAQRCHDLVEAMFRASSEAEIRVPRTPGTDAEPQNP